MPDRQKSFAIGAPARESGRSPALPAVAARPTGLRLLRESRRSA
jgi:hypothetical protein